MPYKLEVIGFNLESCIIAERAGANRIELCDGPGEGGTTPSFGFIKLARKHLSIELYPIIRPRGGDFLYSDEEFEIMLQDAITCKNLGCDGIVTGMLDINGEVDKVRSAKLAEAVYPLGITFHRAFDRTRDPLEALETLVNIGYERILTSGQRPTCEEGADQLRRLVVAADNRIIIMPGSGVRYDNLSTLMKKIGASEYHSSARRNQESKMNFVNIEMKENLNSVITDEEEVRKMRGVLDAEC